MVGSLLASVFFKDKQDTGRLEAVRVQGANYGDPIHVVHGAMRVGGTIVWPRDLELKDASRDGGSNHMWFDPFGWFDQDLPDVHFYRGTWAVLLCRGPVDEVRRIFFNGELVFSTHPDDDEQLRNDSMAMLGKSVDGVEFMLGTEDQEPSPFMVTYHQQYFKETIDDIPGYRGRCIVIFKNFSLEAYGNRLPAVTAEVLRKRSIDTADSWVDISSSLGPNYPSVRSHADAVGFGFLWIAGGFLGGNFNGTDLTVLQGTMDKNTGAISFKNGPYLPQPRESLQLVYTPVRPMGSPAKLYMMGGYGPVDGGMKTYYANPETGDMVMSLAGTPGISSTWSGEGWVAEPIYTDDNLKPFPRDSFGAIFFAGPEPYRWGVWVFGGRNTSDHKQGYEGYGDSYRDLWFFSGTSWSLETEVKDGESEDSGLGYRINPSSTVFDDRLYAGGGMLIDEWASHIPMRDIKRLSFSGRPRFYETPSFDILEGLGFPDKEGWYISNLSTFRDRMIASVSKYTESSKGFYFLESDDAIKWDLSHLYKWNITGTGTYRYKVSGYHVREILDSTTMVPTDTGGQTTFSAVWAEYRFYDSSKKLGIFRAGQWVDITGFSNPENNGLYRITNVAADGSYITVDGTYDHRPVDEDAGNDVRIKGNYLTATIVNSSDIRQELVSGAEYDAEADETSILVGRNPLTSGTFYVDKLSGILLTDDDYLPKSVSLTNFDGTLVFFGGEDNNGHCLVYKTKATATQPESIPLSDIVKEICLDSHLTSDQFDVTELTETLHGFVYDRAVSKIVLEDLRQYGFFDYAEIDGKIKFLRRGRNPVAALPSTELGAYAADGKHDPDSVPDKIKIIRQPEKSLPNVLEIAYFDINRNYEKSIQRAVRQNTSAQKRVTVELPIAMDADKAAQIAYVLLHTFWQEQDSIPLFLTRKYLHLTPCDVITLTNGLESYTARITQVEEGNPGIVSVKAVKEDTLIYDTPQIGIDIPTPPYVNRLERLETNLVFFDIPILSMQDDDHGLYIGAYPVNAADVNKWEGAWVQARQEIEDSHVTIGSINTPLTFGMTDGVLADGSPSTWDRAHSVTVTLTRGTLTSSTEDLVKRGEHVCMLGDEIFQFVDAEDLGNNKYRLSTLLRGRFGTEWATGTHVAGEPFFLLRRESLFRARWSSHAIGKPINYRAVPFYRNEENYTFTEFVGYAKGKKPYAPAHLNAFRDGNGTWRIEWMRRARGAGVLPLGNPVPLNESFERYAVEFVQDDVILHTEYVSVVYLRPTQKPYIEVPIKSIWKNTSGESRYIYGQDRIYNGPTDTVHVRVYQISETVGRGYPAEGLFIA